ncbi:hypothetical protein BCR42DRAFT_487246 [Absidia repens]|uniref:Phosphatidate phosphatase APP1 catalytic domain-containing protein n=1 Tax=Absidia repens TaxID=90262 RepID=A0A1X2IW47_9FUNG|nr:hypothetical protein BCR42DRAFT_487246 [Absidia repens]
MAFRPLSLYTSQHDQHQPAINAYRKKAPTMALNIPGTTLASPMTSSSCSSILTQQEEKAMTRECILFPTYAHRNPQDPSEWVIRTRGWALSHNRSGAKQKFVTSLTKGVVGQNSGDHTMFEERFKYFLAKNKRNKHFTIQAVGTLPLPFETWTSSTSSPTSSTSSSSSALPATPTDNIRMTMDQQRRNSDGSTDSGFQSSGVVDKLNRNQFYHHHSSNSGSDEDEIASATLLSMERPLNPLSSILSGRRMQSTASLPSSLSSVNINDSKQYHGDDDGDDDDGDEIDNNDDDDDDDDDEKSTAIDNKPKHDNSLTKNTPHSDTSTATLSSLFTYPSFTSSTTSNSSTLLSAAMNNKTDIKVDGQAIFKSENSGFFSGPTHLSHQHVLNWAKEKDCCDARLLKLQSTPYNDRHSPHPMDIDPFPESYGMVNLVEPTGISIISDIDDTIKETQILYGARTVLANTFFNASKGIPGMAETYMKWYTQGASFHYVSNSPFQLLPFLYKFLNTERFPPGSMHLRLDGSLMARLIEIPGRAKRDAILSIMQDFPQRQFVLVGDSGEIDLEIYTKIALENPGRILKIFIHDVTTPYAERRKRNKKSSSANNSTSSAMVNKDPTDISSLSLLTGLPGNLVRNSSMSFSSFFQSPATTPSTSVTSQCHLLPPAAAAAVAATPSPPTSSSASLLDSDKHITATHRHSKHKSNSLLDLASSITPSSVLGLGRGRAKTLAELIIEPSNSSSSHMSDPDPSAPPSQQCIQLYDRIRKAQGQLSPNVEVVLFKSADELRDDAAIQDALWQHWDDQCINTVI